MTAPEHPIDSLCADCGGFDVEWMRKCAKHNVEYCRHCQCPWCADEEAEDDYYEEHAPKSAMEFI